MVAIDRSKDERGSIDNGGGILSCEFVLDLMVLEYIRGMTGVVGAKSEVCDSVRVERKRVCLEQDEVVLKSLRVGFEPAMATLEDPLSRVC